MPTKPTKQSKEETEKKPLVKKTKKSASAKDKTTSVTPKKPAKKRKPATKKTTKNTKPVSDKPKASGTVPTPIKDQDKIEGETLKAEPEEEKPTENTAKTAKPTSDDKEETAVEEPAESDDDLDIADDPDITTSEPRKKGLFNLGRNQGKPLTKTEYRHQKEALQKEVDESTQDIYEMTVNQFSAPIVNRKVMQRTVAPVPPVKGWKLVSGYVGLFLVMIGALSLISLVTLFNFGSGNDFYTGKPRELDYLNTYADQAKFWWVIAVPGLASIIIGLFAYFLFIYRRKRERLRGVEDAALVFIVWILAILLNSTPFLLARFVEPTLKFNFTQAVFETVSGLSTTGLSVMTTDKLPEILLFHRSLTNFIGGVGLVLILTSVVSGGGSGQNIYLLEGHSDQLLPNISKSARMIFIIYSTYVVLGGCALIACGLSPLDAFCFSMAALATGGLASHSESTSWFETHATELRYGVTSAIAAEYVMMVLMILGMTNFLVHFYLWHGKFLTASRHFEFFVFLFMLLLIYPIMGVALADLYRDVTIPAFAELGFRENRFGVGFRHAAFEMVSAMSTTGFTLLDPTNFPECFGDLPTIPFIIIIMCMAIGGQAGSTSGGLKQNRVAIFFLNIKWNIDKAVNKKDAVKVHKVYRLGDKSVITNDDIKESSNYFGLYFGAAILSTMLLAIFYRKNIVSGEVCNFKELGGNDMPVYSIGNCFFDSVNCLSGIGNSCGITGYANSMGQWGVLWIEIVGMFVGRLEVTIFLTTIKRATLVFHSRKNVLPMELHK